jgi:hypothetical protein
MVKLHNDKLRSKWGIYVPNYGAYLDQVSGKECSLGDGFKLMRLGLESTRLSQLHCHGAIDA